jgi:hypothetical protein
MSPKAGVAPGKAADHARVAPDLAVNARDGCSSRDCVSDERRLRVNARGRPGREATQVLRQARPKRPAGVKNSMPKEGLFLAAVSNRRSTAFVVFLRDPFRDTAGVDSSTREAPGYESRHHSATTARCSQP